MKILLVNSVYYPDEPGGAERSVRYLVQQFRQLGHDVAVACCGRKPGVLRDEVDGVPVYRIGLSNLYWPFKPVRRQPLLRLTWHWRDRHNANMAVGFAHVLRLVQPDIVHTNNLAGLSVAVWEEARRVGARLVHTLRDYYLLCPSTKMLKNGKNCAQPCADCACFAAAKQPAVTHVDAVVGVSEFIVQRHRDCGWFVQTPIQRAIDNTVPTSNLPAVRQRAWSPQQPVFGYLGRIDAPKGVELLLNAFAQRPDWQLCIAGDGEAQYMTDLQRQATPNVRWLGWVSPADFFAQVDASIVPSLWHEPSGRVIIEARAHGVPVIASNRGGIPEFVLPGQTGVLFEPTDATALLAALDAFVQHFPHDQPVPPLPAKASEYVALFEQMLAA